MRAACRFGDLPCDGASRGAGLPDVLSAIEAPTIIASCPLALVRLMEPLTIAELGGDITRPHPLACDP